MRAGLRSERIVFERATVTEDEYGNEILSWPGTVLAARHARVRFGTAQEKREAAQESGAQSATFECVRSSILDGVTLRDRISYLDSYWDLTETAPLDRKTIRFTAMRTL